MMALAESEQGLCDRLKKNLNWFMQEEDLNKIETDRHKILICKNGGKAPLSFVENLNPENIPEEFQKYRVEVDNDAVREALESGKVLGFAAIGERGTHIRIK